VRYTVGTFRLAQLAREIPEHAGPWAVFFALALAALRSAPRGDLRRWWLIGSSLWLLSSAREGAGPQYFVEWTCAVLVSLAPAAERFLVAPRLPVAVAIVAQLVGADLYVGLRLAYHVRRARAEAEAAAAFCPSLPTGRPVPVEEVAMARACGRVPALHPFILADLARRGLWDQRPFVADLERGAYPVAILPFDPGGDDVHDTRWSPAMVAAFASRYREVARSGEWRLLEWRAQPSERAWP
jgi:hypothetical protein